MNAVSTETRSDRDALMTGADGVARVIAAQPRPIVFGMPGGYAQYIYDALYSVQAEVEVYLVREESLGTVMAEAHGRLTGRPAFVVAQGAWVLGAGGIGVMEAHLGASPMVVLIDATDGGAYSHLGPYQGGLGGHGNYDLVGAMRAITKATFVATDPSQAVRMTQLAIKHATTGEPGPVAVIFNSQSLKMTADPRQHAPIYFDRRQSDAPPPIATAQSLSEAAKLILASKHPVIIAGNGVRLAQAETALIALAEATRTPVVTTPAGKGVFPEDHPLSGGVIGGFGHDAANTLVGEADVLIALGTKLGATDTANQNRRLIDLERQRMVQIDVEPKNLGWTFPADICVQGDVADAIPRLLQSLAEFRTDGDERTTAARKGRDHFSRPYTSTGGALSGRDVVRVLSERLPANAVVTCDAGENRLFVLRDYQAKRTGTVLQPNGGGGMGYAVPAAMAAAITFKGRPAVAVCGDGGISMTLHGLITAIEHELDVTIVVLDNGVLGWVYSGQGDRKIASEFKDIDFAAVASAMGCHAARVDDLDDFRTALEAALDHRGVSLVVAKTTTADRYQDIISALNRQDTYSVARTPAAS